MGGVAGGVWFEENVKIREFKRCVLNTGFGYVGSPPVVVFALLKQSIPDSD